VEKSIVDHCSAAAFGKFSVEISVWRNVQPSTAESAVPAGGPDGRGLLDTATETYEPVSNTGVLVNRWHASHTPAEILVHWAHRDYTCDDPSRTVTVTVTSSFVMESGLPVARRYESLATERIRISIASPPSVCIQGLNFLALFQVPPARAILSYFAVDLPSISHFNDRNDWQSISPRSCHGETSTSVTDAKYFPP
jgi:hypothetical protein